jgi:hypothetical protein
MTESFLSALREFLLAEAQECYWQQAVLRELPCLISGTGRANENRGIIQEWADWEIINESI